jgi:hypothetical protein
MAREAKLVYFFEENLGNPFKDDVLVDLTIRDVPSRLLKEFMQRIVNERYPGGISPAIKELMWTAIQKSKEKQIQLCPIFESDKIQNGGECIKQT